MLTGDLFTRFWNLRESARAVFQRHKATPKQARPILDELREFCRADTSCIVVGKDGHIDTYATAVAEGRREVFLRLMAILNLTDEDILKLRGQEHEDE
ncbi:MAG: hypothetical protein ACOVK7_08035 [Burkholderiaceae bacterium]